MEEDGVPTFGDDHCAGTLPSGVAVADAARPPEEDGGVPHPPAEAGGGEEMGAPAGGAPSVQAEEGGTLEQGGGEGDGCRGEGAADAQGGVAWAQQEGIVREETVVDSVPAVVGPTPSPRESLGSVEAVSAGPDLDAEASAEEEDGDGGAAAAGAAASGPTAPCDGGVISADSSGRGFVAEAATGGRVEVDLSALESDDGEDVVETERVGDEEDLTEGYAVGEGLVEESGGVDGAVEGRGVRHEGERDRQGEQEEIEEDGGTGGERRDGQQQGEEGEEAVYDSEEESIIASVPAGEPVTAVCCSAETERGGAAGQSGVEEGAGGRGEEEEEDVVVPTAEELTDKYLEVAVR